MGGHCLFITEYILVSIQTGKVRKAQLMEVEKALRDVGERKREKEKGRERDREGERERERDTVVLHSVLSGKSQCYRYPTGGSVTLFFALILLSLSLPLFLFPPLFLRAIVAHPGCTAGGTVVLWVPPHPPSACCPVHRLGSCCCTAASEPLQPMDNIMFPSSFQKAIPTQIDRYKNKSKAEKVEPEQLIIPSSSSAWLDVAYSHCGSIG